MGLFSSATKDLRAQRDRGEALRVAGRLDDAAEAYRVLVRELVAEAPPPLPADAHDAHPVAADATHRFDPDARDTLDLDEGTFETIDTLVEELRVVFAQSARILRDTPPNVATDVATAFTVRTLRAGTLLMRAGHAAPGVYAIARGEIALAGSTARGGVRTRVIGLGDVVGDTCTLAGNVASGDVIARAPTTALFLSSRALARLARQHEALAARVAKLSVMRRAFDERLRPDFATSLD